MLLSPCRGQQRIVEPTATTLRPRMNPFLGTRKIKKNYGKRLENTKHSVYLLPTSNKNFLKGPALVSLVMVVAMPYLRAVITFDNNRGANPYS